MYYLFFFVAPTRNNIFSQEVYPRSDFWAFFDKILSTFWKSGRPYYEMGGRTYSKLSRYFFVISKEYPTAILNVRESSNIFNVNIPIFFYPHFSGYFFPVDEPAFFFMKFWLEKQDVFSRFVFVWCQPHLESFFDRP